MLTACTLAAAVTPALCQVSPAEILNPRAKAAEERCLPQIQALKGTIGESRFPFEFRLARYLHAKPGQRAALDSDGIEFVAFQHRTVLKISGIYKAAFNPSQLSENQRAGQTFQEVIVPILRLAEEQIPQSVDYDAIGFEIIYDTRDADASYDYEGKEVLSVVINRDDAFKYAGAIGDKERQALLNRSEIFVNGERFGLVLGGRDSLNVAALEEPVVHTSEDHSSSQSGARHFDVVSEGHVTAAVVNPSPKTDPGAAATFADAMRLQRQYGEQLRAIASDERGNFHLAESAAPAFEVSDGRMVLHFTMRNSLGFEKGATSIYKRAAQSFDLFLAPELRDLSKQLPADEEYNSLQFSVLNQFGADRGSIETIDYVCPVDSLRAFVENQMTSQDLINKSIVLVNGVRIGLELQTVE
jgi:hypothetical protein